MSHSYEEVMAPNLYFDRTHDIEAAKILPGEFYATQRDMLLVTVLGSCVAACIRDKESGIGGMNHYMLPDNNSDAGESGRYGTYAMEILINHLMKLGAQRKNLEAKVFGGGNVIAKMTSTNVGERNAKFVLDYLKTEQIKIVAKDLLDIYPRKVYFFPNSGKVLVKKLRNIHNETIISRENEYTSRLKIDKLEGDVELFT
jgi:chemotaxis protein CheD